MFGTFGTEHLCSACSKSCQRIPKNHPKNINALTLECDIFVKFFQKQWTNIIHYTLLAYGLKEKKKRTVVHFDNTCGLCTKNLIYPGVYQVPIANWHYQSSHLTIRLKTWKILLCMSNRNYVITSHVHCECLFFLFFFFSSNFHYLWSSVVSIKAAKQHSLTRMLYASHQSWSRHDSLAHQIFWNQTHSRNRLYDKHFSTLHQNSNCIIIHPLCAASYLKGPLNSTVHYKVHIVPPENLMSLCFTWPDIFVPV